MPTPAFTDKARAAFILLLEEYAAHHVDPPGFDNGQKDWDNLKADPAALDKQIASVMDVVFDTLYDELDTAIWRRESKEYWRKIGAGRGCW